MITTKLSRVLGPAAVALLIAGCSKDQQPEQVETVQVVKQNAIELVASTARLSDGRFVVHLHKNLFHKGQLIGVDTLRDTLPDLGTELAPVDDGDGNRVQRSVPVEYNILFKVDSLRPSQSAGGL